MRARLNPTANGDVHIGHVYNAYVNQAMSDELCVRFDDNQPHWTSRLGAEKIEEYVDRQLQDFDWMGLKFAEVYTNSELESVVHKVMAKSPHWRMVSDALVPSHDPIVVSHPPIKPFGPTFFITAEKVIQDYHMGVDLMVRGMELLGEDHLYKYLCMIFGYPILKMYYIPRLMCKDGSELTDISKTAGNWKIRELRERGVKPHQIRKVLRRSCLKDPAGFWRVENIFEFPTLDVEEI